MRSGLFGTNLFLIGGCLLSTGIVSELLTKLLNVVDVVTQFAFGHSDATLQDLDQLADLSLIEERLHFLEDFLHLRLQLDGIELPVAIGCTSSFGPESPLCSFGCAQAY